jgi:hypothetical protein
MKGSLEVGGCFVILETRGLFCKKPGRRRVLTDT